MRILIRYSSNTNLSECDIELILSTTKKYGEVKLEKWGTKSGVLDFVSVLELSFVSSVFAQFTKPIIEGYIKGLVNENYFKNLGEKNRIAITASVIEIKNYLSAFYEVFILEKKSDTKAIALIEQIGNVTLYVALNGENVTAKLIDNLGEALVKTYGYVSLGYLNIEAPYVIQLFPNFDTDTWDYLFVPTVEAFGNYINRYFNFNDNKYHFIYSAEEFIEKFETANLDDYKYIISAKHHLSNK
jgi:hypothetical protein